MADIVFEAKEMATMALALHHVYGHLQEFPSVPVARDIDEKFVIPMEYTEAFQCMTAAFSNAEVIFQIASERANPGSTEPETLEPAQALYNAIMAEADQS